MTAPSVPIRHKCGHNESWCLDLATAQGQDAAHRLEAGDCSACVWRLLFDLFHRAGLAYTAPRVQVAGRAYTWEALD